MTYANYSRYNPDRGNRWQDMANIALAVWLFVSPWILQFGGNAAVTEPASAGAAVGAVSNAAWNAWVLGVLVFLVAISAVGRLELWQEWINLVLGAWIFAAPWALGFAYGPFPAASWDHWIVGALVFLLSAYSIAVVRSRLDSTVAARDYDRPVREPMRPTSAVPPTTAPTAVPPETTVPPADVGVQAPQEPLDRPRTARPGEPAGRRERVGR